MPPKPLHLVAAFAGAVALAGVAAGLADLPLPGDEPEPSTAEADHEHAHAGDESHAHDAGGSEDEAADAASGDGPNVPALSVHQPRHESPLPGYAAEGEVPSRAEASELEHQFERFVVEGDEGLTEMRERGYIDGSGTVEDPYVIEGFRVTEALTVRDTTKALVVRESYVDGQLTLNFAGKDVVVHHNHVEDLRVNENVQRAERATGGAIVHNEIPYIGQMRHFTGTFAHNDVGPRPDNVVAEYLSDTGPATLPDEVVALLDGYHLAHVHNNTFEGRVDVKLHGHYHGSCAACPPHDHASPEHFPEDNEPSEDLVPSSRHSYRFHTIDVENNTFRAPDAETALRIHDRNHAGDDQTAASEPNGHLEERHDHHQGVRVAANEVEGGALVFDVVNADDERHANMTQEAKVELVDNEATLERPRGEDPMRAAYVVHAAEELSLDAVANRFTFEGDESAAPDGYRWAVEGDPGETTGFLLEGLDATAVRVNATVGEGADYGVTLDEIAESSRVDLRDNRFQAREEDRHES